MRQSQNKTLIVAEDPQVMQNRDEGEPVEGIVADIYSLLKLAKLVDKIRTEAEKETKNDTGEESRWGETVELGSGAGEATGTAKATDSPAFGAIPQRERRDEATSEEEGGEK